MQVFLVSPDIHYSVKCLDPKRLGNQVYRECLTLIRGGWPNHPASRIWTPHKRALALYALAGLDELARRGHDYPHHRATFERYAAEEPDTGWPALVGYEPFHRSHMSALIRKKPEWYGPMFPGVPNDLEYVWRMPESVLDKTQEPARVSA